MATTKTIKPSGGDYTTLKAWELAIDGDLTGTGVAEAVCYNVDDTDGLLYISGWTTTASDYIYIHADPTLGRHAGAWDADKYNLEASNGDLLLIQEDYVRIDGLQFSVPAVDGANDDIITVSGQNTGANDIRLSNLIIKGASDGTYAQNGILFNDADIVSYVWNCIVYGIGAAGSNVIRLIGGTHKIYSCTGIGATYGINCGSSAVATLKNCYFGGSATEDYYRASGTLDKTNCASSDQSADDTGTGETATNCVAAAVPVGTDTFVNVTAGTEDFHLAAGSALIGTGVDTSGEGAPLNFTTDVDGDTRS